MVAPKPFGGVGDPDERKSREPVPSPVGGRSTEMQLPDDLHATAGQHPRCDRLKCRPAHAHSIPNISF
jgi:hypothetical protein